MDRGLSVTLDNGIVIRPAISAPDYQGCQQAQRKAWGIVDDGYLVPVATMVGAQHHGGLVLGAFAPDGQAVAMSFAFLGRIGKRICLYSQLTGVIPGYQSLGLGYEIKMMQRKFCVEEAIPIIAWAFDPLQAGNARFNLNKLRATSGRFVDNMYGIRSDRLNAGVPTDRLIAEWAVSSDPLPEPMDWDSAPSPPSLFAIPREDDANFFGEVQDFSSARVSLPIPDSIAILRQNHPALAERWRLLVRDAFSTAFARGYQAVGFRRDSSSPSGSSSAYILERTET